MAVDSLVQQAKREVSYSALLSGLMLVLFFYPVNKDMLGPSDRVSIYPIFQWWTAFIHFGHY